METFNRIQGLIYVYFYFFDLVNFRAFFYAGKTALAYYIHQLNLD